MRSGDQLGCVVNPAAAREIEYSHAPVTPKGKRIAVIGAGPAGLTYAERVAEHNSVTVFERQSKPGGALRYAGLAPQFQGVEAQQNALLAFIDDLERACLEKHVVFRYSTQVLAVPDIASEFDEIVVATGATYRLGAGSLVVYLLESGWGKSRLARWLFRSTRVRDWSYHRARKGALPALGHLAEKRVVIIGDAAAPGKTREAIAAAYRAASSDVGR
jgi:flavin-dependent dehydrogenase